MPTQFVFMTTVLLMALFLLALVYETSLHSEERVVWSAALEKSFYVAGGKQANEGIRKASGNKNISVNLLCGNVSAIPPFHNYWTVYVIAPEYNLLTCMVEKAMTTFRTAALCYLHGDDRFVTDNITISSATHESLFMTHCNNDSYIHLNFAEAFNAISNNRTMFSLTRHPLERFLSGFVDKCIVYCNYKDKFKDYDTIRYIEDSNGNEMAKFFDDILKKAGVPKYHRKVIGIEMGKMRSKHSTRGNSAREEVRQLLLANGTLYNIFISIYYHDFIVFDFPIPIRQYPGG